jgi:hypothetical protein
VVRRDVLRTSAPVIVNDIEIIRNLECVVPQNGRAQHVPTVAYNFEFCDGWKKCRMLGGEMMGTHRGKYEV